MRAQREAADEARRVREEASAFLTTARAEGDAVRRQARLRLEEAQEEVSSLARRRDNIAEELRQLSGVIEALAVPAAADAALSEHAQTHRQEEGQ